MPSRRSQTSLSVVGFVSGSPVSQLAMARVARDHHLAAIVVPHFRGNLIQRLRRALRKHENPLASLGAPLIDARKVERLRPDLIVCWSYPHILPASTLAVARLGALNVHMALLPRHRGVDPIFWTYWDDDATAGVTIHWMTERVDAGDVAAQDEMPLERGLASRELYRRIAARGTDLLAAVLMDVARGKAARRPQDESQATYESAEKTARALVPFAQWPAERVWHVLSGLGDLRGNLIANATDQPLKHGRATGFRITADVEPGRVVVGDASYEVHCRDGVVNVDRRN